MTSRLTYLCIWYGKYFVPLMWTKGTWVELTPAPHSPHWLPKCLSPSLVLLCGDGQSHFLKFQSKSCWNHAKSIIIWFGALQNSAVDISYSPLPTVSWILFTVQMSDIVPSPRRWKQNQKGGAGKRGCEGNAMDGPEIRSHLQSWVAGRERRCPAGCPQGNLSWDPGEGPRKCAH